MAKEGTDMLGLTVRDRVTGFVGMVTAQTRHLTACDTLYVQPKAKVDKRGISEKPGEGMYVDILRVDIVQDGEVYKPDVPRPFQGG